MNVPVVRVSAAVTPLAIAVLVLATSVGEARDVRTSAGEVDIVAEPAFTTTTTNVIRWTEYTNWSNYFFNGSTAGLSDKDFLVTATDLATGQTRSVVVSASATSATVPNLTSGRAYQFVVRARARPCNQQYPTGGCADRGSLRSTPPSTPVTSTQDATPPSGTIAIEGGAQFTNRFLVDVHVAALDPGTNSSGVGFVQFSETGSFPCPITAFTCATAYAPQKQVALAPGPDGLRVLYARFYDTARGPAGSATPSLAERSPPGNVSAPTSDTIVLDTRGPALSVTRSAEPAMMNVPVSFDASGSRDQAGLGADSGLDAGTAVWRFGDGTSASGLAVTHTYRAAGSFTAELSIRDRAGNETRSQLPVTVLPSGTPGGATTTTIPPTKTPDTTDRLAPTLAGVGVRRRAGRATLLFRLSEAATVVVELRRLRPRPVRSFGRVTRMGLTGANRLVLPPGFARVLRRRGTYELLVVARDSSGNASQIRRPRVVTR